MVLASSGCGQWALRMGRYIRTAAFGKRLGATGGVYALDQLGDDGAFGKGEEAGRRGEGDFLAELAGGSQG